jgi:energy-coupling factor transport system ATP-binding protein
MALKAALAVAKRFVLLDGGRIVLDGGARQILSHPRTTEIFGTPAVMEAALELRAAGHWPDDRPLPLDLADAEAAFREVNHVEG